MAEVLLSQNSTRDDNVAHSFWTGLAKPDNHQTEFLIIPNPMKNLKSVLCLAVATIALSTSNAQILIGGAPLNLNFNNLNTDFGGAYDATGGSAAFPTSTGSTTIYSGAVDPGFTTSLNDFNPGGVYSNTGTYSNANSMRALRDGASSDLAIGLKDSTDRSLTLRLKNNGTDEISSWAIDYSVEQYSQGASASEIIFSYSLNGSSFITTNLSGAAVVAATAGVDGNLSSVASTSRTGIVTEPIPVGGEIFFRWLYDHKGGTSVHLGIDDITVTPTVVPEPSLALLCGLGGLVALRRIRR